MVRGDIQPLQVLLRAHQPIDVFQLIVVQPQCAQVSQVLESILLDVVDLIVSDVENVEVCVVFENISGYLGELVPGKPKSVQAGERLKLPTFHCFDSILSKVKGP